MPNKYIAHSPPKKHPEKEPHSYALHAQKVVELGEQRAAIMFGYMNTWAQTIFQYRASLRNALCIHDIGKLEASNQEILCGSKVGRLAYDHVDAGVAIAIECEDIVAAWLIRAHHSPGLANVKYEKALTKRLGQEFLLRGCRHNRGEYDHEQLKSHQELIDKTDSILKQLKSSHSYACHNLWTQPNSTPTPKNNALAIRLMLSCLVDADHTDTANYHSAASLANIVQAECKWSERLQQLKDKISTKQSNDPKRQILRDKLFSQCLANNSDATIVTCAAPVGLGKTTAVTANLLQRAIKHKLRHIFVVAPFTNVITQVAQRLREFLVLDGEDPYAIVVEHHHRAEFSSIEKRQYAQTWQAPIIVTTAVQFFETIASSSPTPLRKLHQLPGSAIFIDEAHASVPPHLMRQTWHWIKRLADDWQCHFVLASGSLVKYWENSEIVDASESMKLEDLTSESFFTRTQQAENDRVEYLRINDGRAISQDNLIDALTNAEKQGSKLVILNTVQSAAIIAQALSQKLDNQKSENSKMSDRVVLHVSTALAPADKAKIIDELYNRQKANNPWRVKNWYLVATSCVEAGVDLDFDYGFRERCSVTSFLQTAGRINREALNPNSTLYDFSLIPDNGILEHPAFKVSIAIFENFWSQIRDGQKSLDELSTLAIREEVHRSGQSKSHDIMRMFRDESKCNFLSVQEQFKIISSDTITVIVDDDLKSALEAHASISFRDIQRKSVQIWRNKQEQFGITPCDRRAGLYFWNYGYDPNFLGYMKDIEIMTNGSGWIV